MNKTENVKGFNGIKGLAACCVAFLWHYQHFEGPEVAPFKEIFFMKFGYDYGWLMVELFFMLSGFGMMQGYFEKVFNHDISFKKFILKRLKKIYPLFIFSTLLVTFFELIYRNKVGENFIYSNFDIYHLFLNIFLLQDGLIETEFSFNGPAWCISIFMVLYFLFYVIAYHSINKIVVI